jgi:uncharacterized membrane protein YcaP (DUF421 family)
MYAYTVILLRILGKRVMGQLSMLELAIIISFGSAVGDPMIGGAPVLHGMVAITVVTTLQIFIERMINRNRKVEVLLEGSPDLIVDSGVIQWECLKRDNTSKEDLFRSLRGKEVEHLGQIDKALFETSGAVSIFYKAPRQIKPGLSLLPEDMLKKEEILKVGMHVDKQAFYSYLDCGNTSKFKPPLPFIIAKFVMERWVEAAGQ